MITLILNILLYLSLKSMFCECLWHDPNYYIYIYQLLYILIELLQYLQHYEPKPKINCRLANHKNYIARYKLKFHTYYLKQILKFHFSQADEICIYVIFHLDKLILHLKLR
jgi:hypothetical protein